MYTRERPPGFRELILTDFGRGLDRPPPHGTPFLLLGVDLVFVADGGTKHGRGREKSASVCGAGVARVRGVGRGGTVAEDVRRPTL